MMPETSGSRTRYGVTLTSNSFNAHQSFQTTQNACATVALLNIVMNAPEVELGDQLKEFKKSTKDLHTALRGHHLASNIFIRSIHNSFARRMDHLHADLALENEASKPKSKRSKTRAPSKKGKGKAKKIAVGSDSAFHFIAYVPAGGHVWELDGLRAKPHKLGNEAMVNTCEEL